MILFGDFSSNYVSWRDFLADVEEHTCPITIQGIPPVENQMRRSSCSFFGMSEGVCFLSFGAIIIWRVRGSGLDVSPATTSNCNHALNHGCRCCPSLSLTRSQNNLVWLHLFYCPLPPLSALIENLFPSYRLHLSPQENIFITRSPLGSTNIGILFCGHSRK